MKEDLIQYITNALYRAHDYDMQTMKPIEFDKWVEEQTLMLGLYLNSTEASVTDEYTEETFDLRDELIKFGEWLSTEFSPIIFNMRNTVDEYLTLPKIKKG